MTIWWQSWFEQLIRSREDNGSAQLYLLYLSLTAVGVVLLLAISLYCRFTISVFLGLRRDGGMAGGLVCFEFYPNSSNWLNILVARCWKVFLSVRRKPELPPTQYLVEGSCTLPRIDGLQGYTLPRWVTWIPCYLVTWLPGYLVSGYLVTWLRYIAPCLDWGLAGLHSSKVGYLKEGRHLNLFICMSKHSGGSRTQEMSDKLSIYFEMNEWSWLHLPGWAKAGVTHWGSMLKMGGLLPGRRLSLTDSYSYQLLQGS